MSRRVRVTEDFWAALDLAMPADVEPSWHAFAAHDLPDAVERLGSEWDDLPSFIVGRPQYRILIASGDIVAVYAIEAQLASGGAVELVNIIIDSAGLPSPD